jgi:hypothetical protein
MRIFVYSCNVTTAVVAKWQRFLFILWLLKTDSEVTYMLVSACVGKKQSRYTPWRRLGGEEV